MLDFALTASVAIFSSVVIIRYYFVVDIKTRMCSAAYIVS